MTSPKRKSGNSAYGFLKATLFGGLLFLLPLAIVSVLLNHAMKFAKKVSQPVVALLPDTVAGIGVATTAAVLVLLIISLLAGLLARTQPGRRAMNWFEDSIFGGMPQYQMVKSMAEGLAQVENASGVTPALISMEGGWQMGYLLEELENGWVSVFLPQSPTPMSGNVMYLPESRIRKLDMTMVQAMSIVKRLGVGSSAALRGLDLTPPPGA